MNSQELSLGPWRILPTLNRLESAQGDTQSLDAKAMEVLVMLIEADGNVVSLDELLDVIWKDRVVEPGVVHQKIRAIRVALSDDAKEPTYIETIHKRGYRVMVQNLPKQKPPSRNRIFYWGGAAGICLLLLLFAWLNPDDESSDNAIMALDEGESIAIAPLRDLSPAADLDWLAQGLTEEIRRQISSWQIYDVLPGPLSRGNPQVGAKLPSTYLVDGYLQGTQDEVTLTLTLLDQRTDALVWQESFVGNPENPLAMQARVAAEVARYFNQSMGAMPGPTNPAAYQSYLKGLRHSIYGVDEEIYWFEKALAIDPDWKVGWARLAGAYIQRLYYLGNAEDANLAKKSLDKAIGAPNHFHESVNYRIYVLGDLDTGEQLLAKRLIAQPDDYSALFWYGRLMMDSGLFAEAEAAYQHYTEVIPYWGTAWEALAVIRLHLGDYREAQTAAKRFASLVNVNSGATANWVTMMHEAMAGDPAIAETLIAQHKDEIALLKSNSAWGGAMKMMGLIAEFNLAMSQQDAERATAIALTLAEIPVASRISGMAYLRLGKWDKASEQFNKAQNDTTFGLNFWAFNSLILDTASRSHPLVTEFEASKGVTPQWRRELCRRAAQLPASTHISCDTGQYD